jgi:hypothetical protein
MKRFFTLLGLIFMSQISFAQPPHPGSDSGNSTNQGRRPTQSVNATSPISTGTSLVAILAAGYTCYKVRKNRKK